LVQTILLIVHLTLSGGADAPVDGRMSIGEISHRKAVPAMAGAQPLAYEMTPTAADEDLQAVVLELTGTLTLERAGEPARELRVGDVLEAGDRVVPGAEGVAVLLLRDGSTSQVEDLTEIHLTPGDPSPVFARTSDLLQRYGARAAAEPPPPDRSDAPVPRPSAPANGIPVRVLTPTLNWHPVPGSEFYRITLRGMDGEAREFEVQGDSSAVVPPEWALSPGGAYEWTVTALPLGEPAPGVRFRVLDRSGLDRVAGELRELREAGLDPEGIGSLPAIALFQELDLIYDSFLALDRLIGAGETPVNPALMTLRSHLRLAIRPVYLTPAPSSEETIETGSRR
jgi:hypothetical protein